MKTTELGYTFPARRRGFNPAWLLVDAALILASFAVVMAVVLGLL